MSYLSYITKAKRPRVQSLIDDIKASKDKTFFRPTGTQVYCGRQGSGKTLSAVKHLQDIKKDYPEAIVVSNLDLLNYNQISFETDDELLNELMDFDPKRDYVYFETIDQLSTVLTKVNNGFKGVIYIIDEIHTYFNALDSKNIPPYIFTEISQQRKQRKLIVGTSQLFARMAKPFREQCDNLISCHTFFNFITIQLAYDGMSVDDGSGKLRLDGNLKRIGWFYHTRQLRSIFDTYQKVVSGSIQLEESRKTVIKMKGKKLKVANA